MHRFFGALLQLLIFCNFKPVYLRNISHPDCLPGLSENEFAFGGDGYVSLGNKGFEQRKFSQIKFSFKTSMDEGLIYLTATPDGHFESVELRNGKVIYQFQLNSGQVELATERRYDDGKWHVLEVRWTPEDSSSLVIDDSVESVAQHPEHFKGLNFKSAAYFGGFKGQHNIKGITAKGFNGSIKNVQLGGASRRLNLHTEMKNAYSGCPRRQRRQSIEAEKQSSGSPLNLRTSHIGSTNVELRWNTPSYCYDYFLIEWHKWELASETSETDVLNETRKTVVLNKTVTDYLAEIEELESNTSYTFTLNVIYIDETVNKLKESINATTLNATHPSLIVTSVTNSSLSVKWKASGSFLVSLSGNVNITYGTNITFENLMPGVVYDLKLLDGLTDNAIERKVVTNSNPVYVVAHASGTEIYLTWEDSTEVEVRYRRQRPEECKLKILSGPSGTISPLAYGCMYQLTVSPVSNGRRSGNNQTIDVEIVAKQSENFACQPGDEEGKIICNMGRKPDKACFKYQLNLTANDKFLLIDEPTENTVVVDKLTPGLTYSISIVSVAGNGSSTIAQTTNATAKTGIARLFLRESKSSNDSITINYYKDYKRMIDFYNVTSMSNGTSYFLNDSNSPWFWGSLDAGNCYNFTAYAVSQGVNSKTEKDDICTVPNPPSSVQCLNITNGSLVLAIEKPSSGFVHHYNVIVKIIYPQPQQQPLSHNESTVNMRFHNLRPYYNYEFEVTSALDQRHRKESTKYHNKCRTAEGIPGVVRDIYNRSSGSHHVTLTWHRPYAENGVITFFVVRIYELDRPPKIINVVGNQTSCDLSYPDVYAGSSYKVSISAKTSAGEGQETFTVVILKEAPPPNALFVALASLLAILFIVLISLLLFYYIRKSPQRMMSIRRMSNRLRNASDQMQMVFPQPTVTSKPVKISQFLECMKFLEKDSGLKFTEEYEDLKYVGRNQSRDEAELQCNRVKNRFTNILPYDISRVKLLPMEDEDGSDYINANWIPGFNSKREFIATQGPLPSTINDFWRMVWENNCQAIVMLTLCIEKGHIKCEQYWPSDKEPVFYGDLKVEIQTETKTDEWTILEFKISLGAQSRKLKHCHYVGWPDMYVPEKKSLIAFVRLIRESINTSGSKGPVVVHCSAGVGRTGTFIALDTLLLHIKEGHDLDIYGIVFQMRMNRVLMVQTEAQYVFIYECLNHVLEHPNGEVVEKTKETASDGGEKTKDSQEEPKEKESEPEPNTDTIQQPDKKEVELKPNSDTKEEPDKKELESKPNSDSKEDPSKAALETSSDSNEKKSNNDTVNNPDPEPQKEVAAKQEETNK